MATTAWRSWIVPLIVVGLLALPHPVASQVEVRDGDWLKVEADPGGQTMTIVHVTGARGADATANITMDLNFDGSIGVADDELEDTRSALVVANIDQAYQKHEEFDEPARRRRLVVRTPSTGSDKVTLRRSSPNIDVFTHEEGGASLFAAGGNEVKDIAVGDYWVEGGPKPSAQVGDEFLEAISQETAERGRKATDRIRVTVLWVELAHSTAATMLPAPLYAPHAIVAKQQGHVKLGLHRSTHESEDGSATARGNVEFRGSIQPPIRSRDAFGPRLTTKLSKTEKGTRATAEFGFIFRRQVDKAWYDDLGPQGPTGQFLPDDSHQSLQDVDPDWDGARALIVDNDGPGVRARWGADAAKVKPRGGECGSLLGTNFFQLRDNFITFVVFQSQPGQPPERVSAKRRYAFSADIGFTDEEEATFVIDPPNNNQGQNEFVFGRHIDLTELGHPKPVITEVTLDAIDGVEVGRAAPPALPYEGKVTLTVKGKGLLGQFSLVERLPGSEQPVSPPILARVRVSPMDAEYSELNEVKVTLCTGFRGSRPLIPSPFPYTLKLTNHAGTAEFRALELTVPRMATTGPRRVRIRSLIPQPDESPRQRDEKPRQIITLENTGTEPISLRGWRLMTTDIRGGDRTTHYFPLLPEFGFVFPLPPGQETDITLWGSGYLRSDGQGTRVYLIRPDDKIEDFVFYQGKVAPGTRIDTP